MISICDLPTEILLHVTEYLEHIEDLSSFSRSGNRFIHDVVTPVLYSRVKDDPGVLCWACDEGCIGTVQRLLAAGADPDLEWVQRSKRSRTLTGLFTHYSSLFTTDSRRPVGPELKALYEKDMADDNSDQLEAIRLESVPGDLSDSNSESDTNWSDSEIDFSSDDEDGVLAENYFWRPLHIAARWGHNDIATLLLDHGADVDSFSRGFCDCVFPNHWTQKRVPGPRRQTPIWTPLHTAICHGQDSTVRLLLSHNASRNVTSGCDGRKRAYVTPLHSACSSGAIPIVRLLLNHQQPDIEVEDHLGQTPVSYAYYTGMWECIDLLVENGATLNARIGDWPLLKHACKEGRFAEALRLMDLGADIYKTFDETPVKENPRKKVSALLCCCFRKWHKEREYANLQVELRTGRQKHLRDEVVQALINADKYAGRDPVEWTIPVLLAAANHFPRIVYTLLEAGADRSCVNREERDDSALACALESNAQSGRGEMLETVQVLLKFLPKEMTNTDIIDAISMLLGTEYRHVDKEAVAQMLLNHGTDIDLGTKSAQSLWAYAITNRNIKICQTLLPRGLKPPTRKELGLLISQAIEADSVAALDYLLTLDGGSELMLTGLRLFSALSNSKSRCAEFLIDHGAPICYRSPDGTTSLMQACKLKNNAAAHKLLDKGAELDYPSSRPVDNPLVSAALRQDVDLLDHLLTHGADVHGKEEHFGALELALHMGLLDSVPVMLKSASFQSTCQEDRDAYINFALTVPLRAWCTGANLVNILKYGNVDADCIFSNGYTPLHLAALYSRPHSIQILIRHGANMHKHSTAIPDSLVHWRKDDQPETPLQLAIRLAGCDTVREMLDETEALGAHDADADADADAGCRAGLDWKIHTHELLADYVRAACHKLKRAMIEVLLQHHLDFNIRDPRNGDTAIHMIFSGLQQYDARQDDDDDDEWEPNMMIAIRSAQCLVTLVCEVGVGLFVENHNGISGLELVREKMNYSGDHSFWKELAGCWQMLLVVDDDQGVMSERPGGYEAYAQTHLRLQQLGIE